MSSLRKILRRSDVAPILRRFFTNTLFDSTFMLLGIVIGSSSAPGVGVNVVIVTMITSSLALGISSGISIYEAESLERERSISELERALFRDLKGTEIERSAKRIPLLTALINFFTPLMACGVTIMPFLLVGLRVLDMSVAFWSSVTLAFALLFSGGVYMGRVGRKNPIIKGLRMLVFGLIAFFIGLMLHSLV
jgi:predicted membrane protein (TIGR00267 family)